MNRKLRAADAFCINAMIAVLLLFCVAAGPKGQMSFTASLDPATAKPGQTVTLHIAGTVAEGYHVQSHTPSDPAYIPFEVTVDPDPNLQFGEPNYPAGKNEMYPALGTLNVYTGDVTIDVPLTIKPTAANGATPIDIRLHYQACNDAVCFPPKSPKLTASLTIVGGATTAPMQAVVAPPTTQSAAQPFAEPPVIESQDGTIFGLALGSHAYLLAFSAAFIVGIFFNAMPCVLPVVPLKIMGFYEASQHDRRRCLALGAVFSAGLIATFALLALLVIGFRVLDWGGLFEKTWFTLTIVLVLLAMAVSQFGFFTVNLPTGVYRFAPRHDTYVGNFFFGVLTAALSTPCTIGMFVALLAWALKQPVSIGVLLVIMVGVGMAAPYFVLSAFPELARRFPRTGPLGEIIKQVMAFLLLATAVYFAWPFFNRFVSPSVFWWTLFAVIAAGGIFLVTRTAQMLHTRRAVLIAAVIAIVVTAPSLYATIRLTENPYEWKPYSDAVLAEAQAAGRPVLIDFTATWCGNCHYLEAFVLHDAKVVDVVRDNNVLMLQADVTNDDAPGRPLLSRLNPAGAIPLTAVYLPNAKSPKLLSGIYNDADLVGIFSK